MENVDEELWAEVTTLATERGYPERVRKILLWFGEEALGKDKRMDKTKLHRELLRLGKAMQDQKEEND